MSALETHVCDTPCDDDCDEPCHEAHQVRWKRTHQPPGISATEENPSLK